MKDFGEIGDPRESKREGSQLAFRHRELYGPCDFEILDEAPDNSRRVGLLLARNEPWMGSQFTLYWAGNGEPLGQKVFPPTLAIQFLHTPQGFVMLWDEQKSDIVQILPNGTIKGMLEQLAFLRGQVDTVITKLEEDLQKEIQKELKETTAP
jgi:hypothetical protein